MYALLYNCSGRLSSDATQMSNPRFQGDRRQAGGTFRQNPIGAPMKKMPDLSIERAARDKPWVALMPDIRPCRQTSIGNVLVNILLGLLFSLTAHAQIASTSETGGSAEATRETEILRKEEAMLQGDKVKYLRIFEISDAVSKKKRLPDAVVTEAISDSSLYIRGSIASYPFLQQAQVKELIKTKKIFVLDALLRNPAVNLDPDDIDTLIDLNFLEINRLIVSGRELGLTRKQIDQLASSDDLLTKFLVARRYQIGSDKEIMIALIKGKNDSDIKTAILKFNPIPTEIVDLLLIQDNSAVRRQLTMNGKFTPTPQQLETILNDTDPGVRIGILRRRDVVLSAEQINRGINHQNQDLAFWYRMRNDFLPTPEQIEEGLSSPTVMTRRSYAHMEKITPTSAQIERGLTDSDSNVRWAFLLRKNITLDDRQLDRCTVDPVFQVRDVCVRRPDYQLTQARFEAILFDKNPNILSAFTDRGSPASVRLDQFIWVTLKESPPNIQVALATSKWLPLSDEQIQFGLNSKNEEVRAAFCRRQKNTCGAR
ncbi:hypothetical protein GALL_307030 [mine drainage metagenome]|uniref:Leucine rich repeat variant n=1 Tax=mine drainage metagenome TaxID=410659 RepID=A0A1J5R5Z2_9ZZZZ